MLVQERRCVSAGLAAAFDLRRILCLRWWDGWRPAGTHTLHLARPVSIEAASLKLKFVFFFLLFSEVSQLLKESVDTEILGILSVSHVVALRRRGVALTTCCSSTLTSVSGNSVI